MLSNPFLLRDAALDRVKEVEREKARLFAREARALEELDDLYDGDAGVVIELAGTARIGQVRAGGQCERATRLVQDLPVALALLEAGEMFVGTAEILLALTKKVSPAVRRELDRRISARIVSLDAVDARALVGETVLEVEAELDREEQQRRFAQARADRGVWVKPVEDGMARIGAEVDAVAAREFVLWLDTLDRAEKLADERAGRTRTKAQRQADILVELPARYATLVNAMRSGKLDALLAEAGVGPASGSAPTDRTDTTTDTATETTETSGTTDSTAEATADETPGPATTAPAQPLELDLGLPPAGPPRPWELDLHELLARLLALPIKRPRVLNVHAAATTLLDLDDKACVIEGLGVLPGWMARTLMVDASLRRVLVDRRTGLPLHLSDTPHPPVEVDDVHRRPDDPPGPRPRHPITPPGPDADPGRPSEDPPRDEDLGSDRARRGPAAPVVTEPGTEDPAAAAAREAAAAYEAAVVQAQRRRVSALLLEPAFLPEEEPGYQPSTRLRRLVEVRDLRCVGPGCARTAATCDLDHELEHARGGPTAEWNLSAKSRRCHTARHHGWTATRDRSTGTTTWTSPLGRVYLREPAWRPPAQLPPDVVLGPLPPHTPVTVETWYPDDRPLWPTPPAAPAPAAPAPAPPDAPGRGWGDGPPPF